MNNFQFPIQFPMSDWTQNIFNRYYSTLLILSRHLFYINFSASPPPLHWPPDDWSSFSSLLIFVEAPKNLRNIKNLLSKIVDFSTIHLSPTESGHKMVLLLFTSLSLSLPLPPRISLSLPIPSSPSFPLSLPLCISHSFIRNSSFVFYTKFFEKVENVVFLLLLLLASPSFGQLFFFILKA